MFFWAVKLGAVTSFQTKTNSSLLAFGLNNFDCQVSWVSQSQGEYIESTWKPVACKSLWQNWKMNIWGGLVTWQVLGAGPSETGRWMNTLKKSCEIKCLGFPHFEGPKIEEMLEIKSFGFQKLEIKWIEENLTKKYVCRPCWEVNVRSEENVNRKQLGFHRGTQRCEEHGISFAHEQQTCPSSRHCQPLSSGDRLEGKGDRARSLPGRSWQPLHSSHPLSLWNVHRKLLLPYMSKICYNSCRGRQDTRYPRRSCICMKHGPPKGLGGGVFCPRPVQHEYSEHAHGAFFTSHVDHVACHAQIVARAWWPFCWAALGCIRTTTVSWKCQRDHKSCCWPLCWDESSHTCMQQAPFKEAPEHAWGDKSLHTSPAGRFAGRRWWTAAATSTAHNPTSWTILNNPMWVSQVIAVSEPRMTQCMHRRVTKTWRGKGVRSLKGASLEGKASKILEELTWEIPTTQWVY